MHKENLNNIAVMCNIQRCALLCTSCNGYYFVCLNTVHYSVQYATRETLFLFHRRDERRLTSEQVVSMMYKLYDNNISSESNDTRLDSDDSDTETNELYQLSTISSIVSLIAWCAQ